MKNDESGQNSTLMNNTSQVNDSGTITGLLMTPCGLSGMARHDPLP